MKLRTLIITSGVVVALVAPAAQARIADDSHVAKKATTVRTHQVRKASQPKAIVVSTPAATCASAPGNSLGSIASPAVPSANTDAASVDSSIAQSPVMGSPYSEYWNYGD